VRRVDSITTVLEENFDVIAIDMPMGLSDDGLRSCELDARRFISPRGSTIFPTPVRACLDARDYAHACELSRRAIGKAISIQAWHILPKIRELDECVAVTDGERVIEAHPECSFASMNGDRVLGSKHASSGIEVRTALVHAAFDITPPRVAGAGFDDVLDAFALLWTAERFARGAHREFPSGAPERDRSGRVMRIVV